jgi:hypothetical protein
MAPSDIEIFLDSNPVGPYRITLSSGDQIVIDGRNNILLAGGVLAMAVTDDPNLRSEKRLQMVSVPNIVLFEQIKRRPPFGGRRRR